MRVKVSIVDSIFDNHYEGLCDPDTCSLCKLECGEITQEEFDELWEDI